MRHRAARTTVVGLALLTLHGCSEEPVCTQIGGVEGLVVELPRALQRAGNTLDVELCTSERCASAERTIRRVEADDAGVWFGPEDFAGLEPGRVTASATLREPGGAFIEWREGVKLVATYPNGRECDGEGFVQGTLRLERDRSTGFGISD